MYIPVGILIVLFLINPNLALDLIFIGIALYFWPVTLGIIAVLAIIYGIAFLLFKAAEIPQISNIFSFIEQKIVSTQELHKRICNKIEEKTGHNGILSFIFISALELTVLFVIVFAIGMIAVSISIALN